MGTRFQVLFHSPLGVLFTFPSRYLFTIGHENVFSLGGWSPQIHAGFPVSGATREPHSQGDSFAYGAFTLYRRPSHVGSARYYFCNCAMEVVFHDMWPHNTTCSNATTL